MKSKIVRWTGMVGMFSLFAMLAGCGGVKGDYTCKEGLLESVQLKSGGKAYITMSMMGQKLEKAGTYTVDGDKVNVVIDGESMLFTQSDKLLKGGDSLGTCTKK